MKVKFVCPNCGAELKLGIASCTHCEIPIEWPPEISSRESRNTLCPVCGYNNPAGVEICQSCGAKLPLTKSISASRGQEKKGVTRKVSVRFDWQMYVATLVIILAAIAAYVLYQKKNQPGTNAEVHANVPAETKGLIAEIQRLKNIVEQNPSDMFSTLRLANSLQDAGLYDQAITYYKRYLAEDEQNADARVDMAICYFERGDSKTAISEIEQAIKYNPNHQLAYFNLGIITLTAGNLETATKYFQKAISIDPNSDVGKRAKEFLKQHQSLTNPLQSGK